MRPFSGEVMEVIIEKTYEEVSRAAAEAVADVMNAKPDAVIGMATGSTPLGVYQELVRMHKKEGLDFSQVTTFNLDEYVGLPVTHDQSYRFFNSRDEVPIYAITMGVGTIMEARKIVLLANGKKKADAVAQAVEGPVTSMITASALQLHPEATVYVDDDAASQLKMR